MPTPHPLLASHPNTKYIFQNNNRQNPSFPSHLLLANRIKNTKQTRLIEIFDLTIGERLLRMEAMDRSVRIHPWTKAWAPQESIYGRKEGESTKDRDASIDPVGGARCCFTPSANPPIAALAPTGTAANRVRACTQRVHNRIKCHVAQRRTRWLNQPCAVTVQRCRPFSSFPRNSRPSPMCQQPRVPFIFQGLFIDEGRRKPNSIKVGSKRFCVLLISSCLALSVERGLVCGPGERACCTLSSSSKPIEDRERG